MKTKRGVYTDIMQSTYSFTVGEIIFLFSSKFYRNKFMHDYKDEMKRFNEAANNIYKDKFSLDMTVLSLLRLYALIEKRGFYVIIEGVEVTCPESLKYVLKAEKKTKFGDLTN